MSSIILISFYILIFFPINIQSISAHKRKVYDNKGTSCKQPFRFLRIQLKNNFEKLRDYCLCYNMYKVHKQCIIEGPTMKKSKTISMKFLNTDSKGLLKYTRKSIPGKSFHFLWNEMSYMRRIFLPINLPWMKPV